MISSKMYNNYCHKEYLKHKYIDICIYVMFTIKLQQSAIAQLIDIHYKSVIEVQDTSMDVSLHLLYKVFNCIWNMLIALLL